MPLKKQINIKEDPIIIRTKIISKSQELHSRKYFTDINSMFYSKQKLQSKQRSHIFHYYSIYRKCCSYYSSSDEQLTYEHIIVIYSQWNLASWVLSLSGVPLRAKTDVWLPYDKDTDYGN